MKFSPSLIQGTLVKRYKRFLADVITPEGDTITIHCPNTGSMRACLAPGSACWYSLSDSKTRKYPHTWEIATTPDGYLAGINTHRANGLVEELIRSGQVPEFAGYHDLTREVKYGEGSRIDLLLKGNGLPDCYVEVKNVTLHEGEGRGYFPDAVSSRGAKHLRELMAMVAAGHRAALFFCVQHSGIAQVAAARHIDPMYADLLQQAHAAGVHIIAWRAQLNAASIALTEAVPVTVG